MERTAVSEAFAEVRRRLLRLRDWLETLRLAAAEGRYWEAIDADLAFHCELVGVLGSCRLVEAYRQASRELRLLLAMLDRSERRRG